MRSKYRCYSLVFGLWSLVCIPSITNAQSDFNLADEFMLDSNAVSKIILHGGYFFSSNAITNELGRKYGMNGFITDEIKDGVSKNLESKNRFGGGGDANLFFVFHPDSEKLNFSVFVGVRVRNHIDSRFSKDLFEMFFRGNKDFADKTADLSDFELQSYQYKQFSVGLANAYPLHNGKLYLGAGVNITGGRRFTRIQTKHSTLYTQPEGEYIDADFHILYQRDDSSTAKLLPTEGKGLALDFFAEYETHTNNKIFIGVENFGNIFWNRYSTNLQIDSAFRFEGIDVSDLFNFNDSLRSTVSIDSTYYQNFLTNRKMQRITTKLPATFTVAFTHPFLLTRYNVTVGVSYLAFANSMLRYFVTGNYKMNAKNEFLLTLAYGGYDKFNVGLKYERQFAHGFSVEVGSDYLSSMIMYNNGHSQGAFVSLAKKFQ